MSHLGIFSSTQNNSMQFQSRQGEEDGQTLEIEEQQQQQNEEIKGKNYKEQEQQQETFEIEVQNDNQVVINSSQIGSQHNNYENIHTIQNNQIYNIQEHMELQNSHAMNDYSFPNHKLNHNNYDLEDPIMMNQQTLIFMNFDENNLHRFDQLNNIPNQVTNYDKINQDSQLMPLNRIMNNSSSHSDSTLQKQDNYQIQQQGISPSFELIQSISIPNQVAIDSDKQMYSNEGQILLQKQSSNQQIMNGQNNAMSHLMDDNETSNFSSSLPKKKKRGICKNNNSPRSRSSSKDNNKKACQKKSQPINNSIFSGINNKKDNQQQLNDQNSCQNSTSSESDDNMNQNNLNNNISKYNKYQKNQENKLNNNENDDIQDELDDNENVNDDDNISNNNQSQICGNKTKKEKTAKQQNCQEDQQQHQSKKVRFTNEEDEALINLITIHGKKWKVISELMNGKNETRIRNRYYSYIRKIIKPDDNESATPIASQDIKSDNLISNNAQQQISEQNPESFQQESTGSSLANMNQLSSIKQQINDQLNQNQFFSPEKLNIPFNQNTHLLYSIQNNKDENNQINQQNQQQQQSTLNNPPFFNSTLFDSVNILTLNNFDKDFNGFTMHDMNHFQSNLQDSLLVQSNNNLYPFSSNNLNFDQINQNNNKIPSFKFLNRFEGSLTSLDPKQGKQYLNYNKSSIQEFECIDAEEYNHKFYQSENQNNNNIFSSIAAIQEEDQAGLQQHQNNYQILQNSTQKNHMLQNFCPNKFVKSYTDFANYDEPSPLIFAKASQGFDPMRFVNQPKIPQQQQQQQQQPIQQSNDVSKFSMEDEMVDEDQITEKQQQKICSSQTEENTYINLSDKEKIQKIQFLNTQVENISTMIEQCKQQILSEILSKVKTNN